MKHAQLHDTLASVNMSVTRPSVKSIVLNVLKACRSESKRNRPRVSFSEPLKRAGYLLGVSERTVKRYSCESDSQTESVSSSAVHVNNERRGRKKVLDIFDKSVIRNASVRMLKENKTVTLDSLKREILLKHDISVNKMTLWRALHSLGFRFGRLDKKRQCLYERKDIVKRRIDFLRKIKAHREENRPIVYLDETWVDSNAHPGRQWQAPEGQQQRKLPLNKGKRFVVLHCGGEMGFLPGCNLVFNSKSNDGDYHSEINGPIFKDWVERQLLPALPARSVVVMDPNRTGKFAKFLYFSCADLLQAKGSFKHLLRAVICDVVSGNSRI